MKQLVRSVYFLLRHRIPHTTTFDSLIELQIDNGNEHLKEHQNTCPANATYLSTATTAELLKSISYCIEEQLLTQLKSSSFLTKKLEKVTCESLSMHFTSIDN